MPLEGHYERQTTPLYKLSRREIRAASATLLATLAAMAGVVIATAGDSAPPTPQGCIKATVAGVVGAETISGCGAEAEAKCAQAAQFDSPRSDTVVAECEAQGVPLNGATGDPSQTRRKG
ncbi:MAG TPA: hypothetical protein VFS64_01210 [Solirubrobacterales bacterium]|nr:hypothetical protein [Solirubrobacterales bacterium]